MYFCFQANISKSTKTEPQPVSFVVSLAGEGKEEVKEADELKLGVAKDTGEWNFFFNNFYWQFESSFTIQIDCFILFCFFFN